MRRMVLGAVLLSFVALACGREGSIVPVVSLPPTASPSETPTEAPTFTPEVTVSASPSPTASAAPTPTGTPIVTPAPSHAATPKTAPPDSYLTASAGQIKGDLTMYNWQEPSGRKTFTDQPPDPATSFTVTRGEKLTISFTRSDSMSDDGARYRTNASFNAHTTAVPMTKHNPATIVANFPVGTIWLDVFTYWAEGDAEHTYKLNVH